MNHLNETIAAVATKRKNQSPNGDITIVSLEPVNLLQVAESFVTVAKACHVEERGAQLKNEFLQNLKTLNSTVREAIASTKQSQYNNIPRILILEWLDPPFDAGHWVPEMISYAACYNASNMSRDERKLDLSEISNYGNDDKFHEKEDATFSSHYNHKKSKQITWDDIYIADPGKESVTLINVAPDAVDLKGWALADKRTNWKPGMPTASRIPPAAVDTFVGAQGE